MIKNPHFRADGASRTSSRSGSSSTPGMPRVLRTSRAGHMATAAGASLLLWLASSCVLAQPNASGEATLAGAPVFASPYVARGEPGPGADQARIVYYRLRPTAEPMFSMASERGGATNIYVDGEFQSALLPGGFSSFCVAAGDHRVGAFTGDAPGYAGKSGGAQMRFEARTTYFFRVLSDGQAQPAPLAQGEAERELQQSRRQNHVVSRAAGVVQPCRELASQGTGVAQAAPGVPPAAGVQAMPQQTTAMAGQVRGAEGAGGKRGPHAEVLFEFARADVAPLSAGHPLSRLIELLKDSNAVMTPIEVVGYADAIGTSAAAYSLGLERAQEVRRVLVKGGIPVSSIRVRSGGNADLVVRGCVDADLEARIACNAPNRRAIVRLAGQ